ncbi:hypothetical protein D9M68_899600 [compost metagenome]
MEVEVGRSIGELALLRLQLRSEVLQISELGDERRNDFDLRRLNCLADVARLGRKARCEFIFVT